MNFILASAILLLSTYSLAGIQTGKLAGTDNYGNPCWVNITEAKNEIEPLLISHKIKVISNYLPDSLTLTHPIQHVNNVFKPAPEYYTGRLLKPNQPDPTDIAAAKAIVTLHIDKDHNPTAFTYHYNEEPKEFRRRNFECKFSN